LLKNNQVSKDKYKHYLYHWNRYTLQYLKNHVEYPLLLNKLC